MEKAPQANSTEEPSDNQPSGRPRAAEGPQFGALLDCLNCERNHAVIDILHNRGEQTLRDLANLIAADGGDVPRHDDGSCRVERVRIGLHQNHLRKLDTAGVVEWTGPDEIVSPGPAFGHAREMLHGARDGYAEAEAGGEGS